MKAVECAEQASEIFVLSDSFVRIKELIDDETSTIDDIADVILIDPTLSASILKLANSSFFNYPGKIDTISKAVLVLGITEVYNLVIAYFTTEAFKSISADAEFLEEFWERSVDCALFVKFIGVSLKVPNAERLFILGLLHSLGELVVKQFMPDKVEACQSENVAELPWNKQQEILGFTYAECTAELLKIWQLPFSLIEPIRYQDEEDYSITTVETQLLYLAKRLVANTYFFPKEHFSTLLSESFLEEIGAEQDLIKSSIKYCDMERLGILSVLKPSAAMIY